MFGYKLVKEKDIHFLKQAHSVEYCHSDIEGRLQFLNSLRVDLPPDFIILDTKSKNAIHLNIDELKWLNEVITRHIERYNLRRGPE